MEEQGVVEMEEEKGEEEEADDQRGSDGVISDVILA